MEQGDENAMFTSQCGTMAPTQSQDPVNVKG